MAEIQEIPIEKIKVGEHEQRLDLEDEGINELAASIVRIGLVSPLVVAACGDGYTLIAGHRRLQAAKKSGMGTLPCIVRESKEADAAEISFAENFFRKDLSPVELACALKDCLVKETLTVKELAAGFHRSEHWVHSMIAIADWSGEIQEAIHKQKLSVSAASNLACVTDDSYRAFLVRNAVEQGATARTTAAWLQAWQAMQPQEEAITAEPVAGSATATPLVPQAPCLCCAQQFPVNRMSHVPLCGGCIPVIRQVGISLGEQVAAES